MATDFLSRRIILDHVLQKDINPFRQKSNINFMGKALAFDCPVKDFITYAANTLLCLHMNNYSKPVSYMGNEGGAILAALLAAGLPPSKILDAIEYEGFSPLSLIEGDNPIEVKLKIKQNKKTKKIKKKAKVKGKKMSKVHSAQHKGRRFSDVLDLLLESRLDIPKLTLGTLYNRTKVPLYITVMDEEGMIIYLSWKNYPKMLISDAVRASCAVQPLVARVAYTDPNKGIYKFAAATPRSTLDYEMYLKALRQSHGGVISLDTHKARESIVGFGWSDQVNAPEYISKKNDYYHKLNKNRASPVGLTSTTRIFGYGMK